MKKSQGFTLIELLTYVGIFAVVAGLLTGILAITLKVQNRESAAGEVTNQLNFVLQTVQRLVRESSLIEMDNNPTSTLKLRMKDQTKGITTIYLENNAVLIKEKNEVTQVESISNLTSDKVIVDQLTFKKFSQPPGHDTVSVDMQMTYNSQNQQSQFSKTLHSAIARVSAATFDSDLLPGADNSYSIGINPNTRWKDISISNLLNIGQLATDPSNAQNGSMYYNTASSTFRGYKNGSWSNLGESFWTATGNNISNNNSGNVGIGTNNPLVKLAVNGDIVLPENSGIYSDNGGTLTKGGRLIYREAATDIIHIGTPDYGNPLYIDPYGAYAGANVIINPVGGNVGIGTANPGAKLEVAGNTKITGNLYGGGSNYLCLRTINCSWTGQFACGGNMTCPAGTILAGFRDGTSCGVYDAGYCCNLVLSSTCP